MGRWAMGRQVLQSRVGRWEEASQGAAGWLRSVFGRISGQPHRKWVPGAAIIVCQESQGHAWSVTTSDRQTNIYENDGPGRRCRCVRTLNPECPGSQGNGTHPPSPRQPQRPSLKGQTSTASPISHCPHLKTPHPHPPRAAAPSLHSTEGLRLSHWAWREGSLPTPPQPASAFTEKM